MMIDMREYYRQWKQIPYEKSPPGLSRKIIERSGILKKSRTADYRSEVEWRVYLCANLAVVVLLVLMIGINLFKTDLSGQQRLTINTINIAQNTSHSLEAIVLTKGDEL